MTYTHQLIVIGAGSGGLVAAEFAASLGANVAMIEKSSSLGGECLHAGCVPSKALIAEARRYAQTSKDQPVTLDYKKVHKHIKQAISHIETTHDNDAYYQAKNIEVIHGEATFINKSEIKVGLKTYRAKKYIIATGSRPFVPSIPGLAGTPYLTNDSVFDLKALPKDLIVIGGGPIGCEIGQAMAMLGSNVTILHTSDRLLPRDEPEVSQAVMDSFKHMKITVRLSIEITSVEYVNGIYTVNFASGKKVTGSDILVATGRQAVMPGGLDLAKVKTTDRGIVVNRQLRTNRRHILAVGDCNAGPQFTHAAADQAVIAVRNALFGLQGKTDPALLPWTTFTTPENAHFGPMKDTLKDTIQDGSSTVLRKSYDTIDKATAESEPGVIEMIIDRKGKVIAATVIGHNAGEIVAQIRFGGTIDGLASVIQAYPTYGIAVKEMASQYKLAKFQQSTIGKFFKKRFQANSLRKK